MLARPAPRTPPLGRARRWSLAGVVLCVGLTGPALAQPLFAERALLFDGSDVDNREDRAPRLGTSATGVTIAVWSATTRIPGVVRPRLDVLVARSLDMGVTWSAPRAIAPGLDQDAAYAAYPDLAVDDAGTWIVVWQAVPQRDPSMLSGQPVVFMARSSDDGLTWGSPVEVDPRPGTRDLGAMAPHIATNGAGRWLLVWSSGVPVPGGTVNNYNLWLTMSDDGGVEWTAPKVLNTDAGHDVRFSDDYPWAVTDRHGTWVVAWLGDYELQVARSLDDGMTWTAPTTISGAPTGSGPPRMATDGATVLMAWAGPDATLKRNVVAVARSTDLGQTWAVLPRILGTYDVRDVDIVTDRDGGWMVSWRESNGVTKMAFSHDAGSTWRSFEIDRTVSSVFLFAPAVSPQADASWLVIWNGAIPAVTGSELFVSRGRVLETLGELAQRLGTLLPDRESGPRGVSRNLARLFKRAVASIGRADSASLSRRPKLLSRARSVVRTLLTRTRKLSARGLLGKPLEPIERLGNEILARLSSTGLWSASVDARTQGTTTAP